ncbi:hypothetical protein V8F20_002518 [Naviculisporaceae sp. PSN 640]
MANNDKAPADTRDALEVLESEAKEWEKVVLSLLPSSLSAEIILSKLYYEHTLIAHASVLQDAEIDRILKAFRLNAYAVLELKPGVPESDIKKVYRAKSLLIHPDKTKNERAPEAFDRLKKAQTELMDEKHRANLDEAIADARMLAMRDMKLTVDSPEIKTPEFEKKWTEKTTMVLIDNEQRRKRQLKAQMQEEGREQRKQEEEAEARKRKRQHEEDWEATRDVRIDSWRKFQKSKSGGSDDKKKKKKMKVLG